MTNQHLQRGQEIKIITLLPVVFLKNYYATIENPLIRSFVVTVVLSSGQYVVESAVPEFA
jgi:hypothetical protein